MPRKAPHVDLRTATVCRLPPVLADALRYRGDGAIAPMTFGSCYP